MLSYTKQLFVSIFTDAYGYVMEIKHTHTQEDLDLHLTKSTECAPTEDIVSLVKHTAYYNQP